MSDGSTKGTAGGARVRIVSTGAAVPDRALTNAQLAGHVETSDEWIAERTGIEERRIAADDQMASDLAAAASLVALERAGVAADDLELIVVATISADQPLPSCAVHVQRKLGARCPAFDIAAACAGFLYGLEVARRFVETGCGPVLVVGVEVLSRLLDWHDRETCVLFGDGAGAVVVDRSDERRRGLLASTFGADGRWAHLLQVPVEQGVIRMQGREVFRLAVTELSAACLRVLSQAGMSPGEVDLAVMHQANRRILEAIARRTGIAWSRFHLTIDRWGNTSSASIPLGLDDAVQAGRITGGQTVLMGALGAGATWGAMVVRF